MKCLCTNVHSLGNKQGELEASVVLENHNIAAVTKTWWDESYDWTATSCSEETGEEGGEGVLIFTSGQVYNVKSCP